MGEKIKILQQARFNVFERGFCAGREDSRNINTEEPFRRIQSKIHCLGTVLCFSSSKYEKQPTYFENFASYDGDVVRLSR